MNPRRNSTNLDNIKIIQAIQISKFILWSSETFDFGHGTKLVDHHNILWVTLMYLYYWIFYTIIRCRCMQLSQRINSHKYLYLIIPSVLVLYAWMQNISEWILKQKLLNISLFILRLSSGFTLCYLYFYNCINSIFNFCSNIN